MEAAFQGMKEGRILPKQLNLSGRFPK